MTGSRYRLFCTAVLLALLAACSIQKRKKAEPFKPVDPDALAAIVEEAPAPAEPVWPELNLKLVDYIRCGVPDDPHPFRHDGRSRIVAGPGGPMRETGAAANSFFAYRFTVGQLHSAHLVVVEYPDDKERAVTFAVHEEGLKGKFNGDFHIENGVYTGGKTPLSGRMRYYSFFFWPADKWPGLVCVNQQHLTPAAAARIWVYQVLAALPEPKISEPDSVNRRKIGIYFEDTRAVGFDFGRQAPLNLNHLAGYMRFMGLNLLATDAVLYRWPKCKTRFLPGGNDEIGELLSLGDETGFEVMAVFDPVAATVVNGIKTGKLDDPRVAELWVDAMEDFIRTYNGHPSLTGISFGGPAGSARLAGDAFKDVQMNLYNRLKIHRSPVKQYLFFGSEQLHHHFFQAPGHTPYDLIRSWEKNRKRDFREKLAYHIRSYWKERNLDPYGYKWNRNLVFVRNYYPADSRLYRHYAGRRTPRWQVHDEFNQAQEVADMTVENSDLTGACLFHTYFERATYLNPKDNEFWWPRKFIAAQMYPPGRHALREVIQPLIHADTDLILSAGWHTTLSGYERPFRQFVRAFRSLPARRFKTVSPERAPVILRVLRRRGKCYFYLLNTTGEQMAVSIRLKNLADISNWVSTHSFHIKWSTFRLILEPYELAAFYANYGLSFSHIRSSLSEKTRKTLRARIVGFKKDIRTARQAGIDLPKKYDRLQKRVWDLYRKRRYGQASDLLGTLVPAEPAFRTRLAASRDQMRSVPLSTPVTLDGSIGEWTGPVCLSLNKEEQLTDHIFIPNHWTGPDDLAADIYAAHDNRNLYFAFRVSDDRAAAGDEADLLFSVSAYRGNADTLRYDTRITIPFALTEQMDTSLTGGIRVVGKRDETGTVTEEVRMPRSLLPALADTAGRCGLTVIIKDMDDPEFLTPGQAFARDNVMVWPAVPGFDYWTDPRMCGELMVQ